jgi:triphosphatase
MTVDAKSTLEDAFRAIGNACLTDLERSREGVEQRQSEGVHEMRVALRRLRAAMTIFEELLRDDESEGLKAELEWLAAELGDARDYDVFVGESRALAREAELHPSALGELMTLLTARRKAGFERATRAVTTARFRTLVGALTQWLESGHWALSPDDAQKARRNAPVRALARALFEDRSKKAQRRLKKFEELEAEERHQLRIAVKKLRYAGEFFAGVFPKRAKARSRYLAILKELQDTLGELNDWAVHEQIARSLVDGKPQRGKAVSRNVVFALGLVRGHEGASIARLMAAAAKSRKRLAAAPRFWR